MDKKPLLSISIPTYNRSKYLGDTLKQLHSELADCKRGEVELIVSDNASPDETESVVKGFKEVGLALRYVRNNQNIGSDANIAQCFNLAKGNYVLILGDDDLFVDGGLSDLLDELRGAEYGVACLRAYGFDHDFRKEYPGEGGKHKLHNNAGSFLADIGPLMTFISGCVINKSLLRGVNANDYCGENLVQVHLVIQAAVKAKQNLLINRYMIACKRNNSGGYDFAKVFVEHVGNIVDLYIGKGLTRKDVLNIERKFIISYFPFYLMKQHYYLQGDIASAYSRFKGRYGDRLIFYLWLYPILKSPRWIAIAWGAFATLVGRTINGDLVRGLFFFKNKIHQLLSRAD
jgi:glycosyltransferase involved in cell wall biosynthesis